MKVIHRKRTKVIQVMSPEEYCNAILIELLCAFTEIVTIFVVNEFLAFPTHFKAFLS